MTLTENAISSANDVVTIKVAEGTNYNAYTANDVQISVAITPYVSVTGLGSQNPADVVFTNVGSFPDSYSVNQFTMGDGNVYLRIGTMYRTIDEITNGQITAFTISERPIKENSQPYSAFVRPDGTVANHVFIGKHCSSSSTLLDSKPNTTPVQMNVATARAAAVENGAGYQLFDWQFQKLYVDLAMCTREKVDFCDGSTPPLEHYLIDDLELPLHVDGIAAADGHWYIANDPTNYVNEPNSETTGYTEAGYTVTTSYGLSGNVKSLGYDINNPFFNYPNDLNSDALYSTYYCDICQTGSDNRHIRTIIGGSDAVNGLFSATIVAWTRNSYARLCLRFPTN